MIPRVGGRYWTGGAWALLTVGVALCATVVRTLVVARFLGPHELGLMAIAILALGTLDAVSSTGFDTALVSEPDDVESDLDPAFTVQAVRGVVVTAGLWAAAPLVASLFNTAAAVPVIRSIGFVALIRGFANPAVALLVRKLEFRRLFWWTLPETLVGLGLALWLAPARHDVWALVIAVLGAQTVAAVMSYVMVPRRPRLEFRGEHARRLLRFSKWVSVSRTLTYFSVTADAAVVGTVYGAGALGLYQFACRIAELPVVTFTRAVARVVLPGFSERQGSPERLQRAWWSVFRVVVLVSSAFAVVVLLFGDVLVARLVGSHWLPAVPPLRILAAAMVFRAVVVVAGQLFDGVRQPRLTLRVNAVRLGVLLVAIGPLTWAFGTRGVAGSVLLASLAAAA
ncbi:MAG: oligosaccharide flippase family protein, partial [Gemmatimonadales bacterium]